jgi:cell division protein FtsB
MASSAATARAEAVAEPKRLRRRAAGRRADPLRNGVAWIFIAGTLLAGLVALNVAVLGLNVRLDRLGRERATLRDQNAALESQLSGAKLLSRIEARARDQLGLVPAANMTYVELGK